MPLAVGVAGVAASPVRQPLAVDAAGTPVVCRCRPAVGVVVAAGGVMTLPASPDCDAVSMTRRRPRVSPAAAAPPTDLPQPHLQLPQHHRELSAGRRPAKVGHRSLSEEELQCPAAAPPRSSSGPKITAI